MAKIKVGSVVVVSNPHLASFAYRGTLGTVTLIHKNMFYIKSTNGHTSSWKEEELKWLHD